MPDAVEPTDALGYRDDVQGLRGVAVLAVVLYHANALVPGGFVGVDMFFVISGFVITASFRRELRSTGTVSISEFFSRRVRRILPALGLMVTVTLAVSLFVLSPIDSGKAVGETARAASVSTANFQLYGAAGYFAPEAESNPLLHTWSLSVEEQFYIFFAVLVGLLVAVTDRYRIQVLGATALLAMSMSVAFGALVTSGRLGDSFLDPQRLLFFSPFARGFEFLAGVVMAAVATKAIRPRLASFGGVLGVSGVAFAFAMFDAETVFPGTSALLPVLSTAAIIWSAPTARWLRRVLSLRAITWFGDISYSWYLWHWPMIVFARSFDDALVAPAVGASIVAAMLSFRHVEGRFRHSGDRVRRGRAIAVAMVSIGVPLVFSSVYLVAVDTGLGLAAVDDFEGRTQARDRGCHGDLLDPILPIAACTWSIPDSSGLVLLVGDSHAISIADAVTDAGRNAGYDVAVQTRSICPFQTRRVIRSGCANYQRETLRLVQEMQPNVLVIANRSTIYAQPAYEPPSYTVVDENDRVLDNRSDALHAWRDGMEDLMDEIDGSVDRVVIFETAPEFEDAGGRSSISLLRPNGRPATSSLEEVNEWRTGTMEIHRDIAATRPWVTVVDPVPRLCTDVCSQRLGEDWIFYDDDHLSLSGAQLLVPLLEEAIRKE